MSIDSSCSVKMAFIQSLFEYFPVLVPSLGYNGIARDKVDDTY